ncbi:MAG TPA: glutamate--tRNA ligase [Sedimentisphaerales bacterium]|nr:glutamate--tRNA ligase [Sedimentisphaerales bacterium]
MSEKVVTRFAPSPTGYLHVGGARTALFSWLLARRTGGRFILRIEDTDLKRNTPTATQQVITDLRWLGINWDEGPEVGGPNGPYLQSERKDIYDKYIGKLIDEKKAYYCFDTADELQEMRERAESEKKGFAYNRPDVFPTEQEVQKAQAAGLPVTVRFAMPQDETIVVNDVVRGQVSFSAGEFGDFIIRKSDGYPTYNFACVIDDELMGVTHVIRGQEHLMNTPGQQALQKALGFRTPVYAHMSVTVSEGGGKLSKRERPKALRNAIKAELNIDLEKLAEVGSLTVEEVESFVAGKTMPDMPAVDAMANHLGISLPEINVVDFFNSGYLPETLVNFIALLGFNPGGDREIMPIEDLIACFDLSRLTKSNSLFDRGKLLAFNTEHIRMAPREKLVQHFKNYLKAIESPVASADDELISKIVDLSEGARTLAQIEQKSRFLFLTDEQIKYDEKAIKKVLLKDNGLPILQIVRDKLAAMEPFTAENIETMLRSLAEEKGLGLGKIAQPLRVAICGTTISLPIFDSVRMLGKENTLARIDITLGKFGEQTEIEET